MSTLEDWALIRRLAAEGVPKAQIARGPGIARGTVISAVKSDAPPVCVRAPGPTSFTVFEPRVRELLAQTPDMPATVLAERVGWSRFVTGRMIPTRKAEDLLLGSWGVIKQLDRVPRRLIWDNEPGIGRGRRRAEDVEQFMGTLATTKLVLLPPNDPQSKGIVERRNGWFETSFMPGRTFRSPDDFNTQFSEWLVTANARVVRTIGAAPVDRLGVDLAAMLPLPPIPLHLG